MAWGMEGRGPFHQRHRAAVHYTTPIQTCSRIRTSGTVIESPCLSVLLRPLLPPPPSPVPPFFLLLLLTLSHPFLVVGLRH